MSTRGRESEMTAQGTHGMDVMRCDGSEHLLALSKTEPSVFSAICRKFVSVHMLAVAASSAILGGLPATAPGRWRTVGPAQWVSASASTVAR